MKLTTTIFVALTVLSFSSLANAQTATFVFAAGGSNGAAQTAGGQSAVLDASQAGSDITVWVDQNSANRPYSDGYEFKAKLTSFAQYVRGEGCTQINLVVLAESEDEIFYVYAEGRRDTRNQLSRKALQKILDQNLGCTGSTVTILAP